MILVNNALDISTLLLVWQSNVNRHQRYRVGKVVRLENEQFAFSYDVGTDDYKTACAEGFTGYPAFKLDEQVFTNNVIDTFMKRLPPRKRKDFKKYLRNQCLPEKFEVNDFVLIAHTGVRLPSDGFDLIPDLSEAPIPFDYLTEVAGTRYDLSYSEFDALTLGAHVYFEPEPDNEYDENAIAVYCGKVRVGYVNRLLCSTLSQLLATREVTAVIAKKSGTKERPLLYLMLMVRETLSTANVS